MNLLFSLIAQIYPVRGKAPDTILSISAVNETHMNILLARCLLLANIDEPQPAEFKVGDCNHKHADRSMFGKKEHYHFPF